MSDEKKQLTAAEAYAAGKADVQRAMTIVQQLISRGTIDRGQTNEAMTLTISNLWKERIERGELPEVLS